MVYLIDITTGEEKQFQIIDGERTITPTGRTFRKWFVVPPTGLLHWFVDTTYRVLHLEPIKQRMFAVIYDSENDFEQSVWVVNLHNRS